MQLPSTDFHKERSDSKVLGQSSWTHSCALCVTPCVLELVEVLPHVALRWLCSNALGSLLPPSTGEHLVCLLMR